MDGLGGSASVLLSPAGINDPCTVPPSRKSLIPPEYAKHIERNGPPSVERQRIL